jgi:predicted ferric reductase
MSLSGPGLWYATRATGLVTLLLLTISMMLGMLTAARSSAEQWPRFLVVGLHRNLSLVTLVFLALHVGTTVADSYTSIGPQDAIVPFISAYHTWWLGLGAVASDLLIALVLTSVLRRRLGHRAWRAVHWCGYLCWPVALAHGLGIGTDRGRSWVFDLTITCISAVAVAGTVRILSRWPARRLAR